MMYMPAVLNLSPFGSTIPLKFSILKSSDRKVVLGYWKDTSPYVMVCKGVISKKYQERSGLIGSGWWSDTWCSRIIVSRKVAI